MTTLKYLNDHFREVNLLEGQEFITLDRNLNEINKKLQTIGFSKVHFDYIKVFIKIKKLKNNMTYDNCQYEKNKTTKTA